MFLDFDRFSPSPHGPVSHVGFPYAASLCIQPSLLALTPQMLLSSASLGHHQIQTKDVYQWHRPGHNGKLGLSADPAAKAGSVTRAVSKTENALGRTTDRLFSGAL